MKSVKVRTKFDYKAMKYLNLYLLKYKRKTFLLYGVLIAMAVGFGTYLLITNPSDIIWPIVFALVVVYTVYQMFSIEKNLDKQLANFFNTRPVIEQIIELSSEKLTITVSTRPNEPVDYDWAYISEIVEIPEYYFLFVSGNNPIILDKENVEGSLEDLDAIIKEKAETKPYKKLDKEIARRPITYVHPDIQAVTEEEARDAHEVEGEETIDVEEHIANIEKQLSEIKEVEEIKEIEDVEEVKEKEE